MICAGFVPVLRRRVPFRSALTFAAPTCNTEREKPQEKTCGYFIIFALLIDFHTITIMLSERGKKGGSAMEAGKKRRIKRKVLKVAKLITEGLIRGAAAAAIGALIRYLIER
jgi:hypothetical protein